MRRIAICFFVFAIALSITGCVNFGEPARDEYEKVTTSYGDEFIVAIKQLDFPSQKTFLTVRAESQETTILSFRLEGNLDAYDYENDIVENWLEIIAEYQNGNIKAYQFHWGIIYTADGKNYTGSAKHNYYETMENDPVFEEVYYGLGNTEEPVSRVDF